MRMIPAEHTAMIKRYSETPPVDLIGIAEELGLKIFSTSLPKGVSGILFKDPDYETRSGFVIFVDSDEPSGRQRFTAAHEIGHFLLHKDRIKDRVEDNYLLRSGMRNSEEVEANRLAADILMPRDLIEKAMQEGHQTVEALANLFGVSGIAMGIRLGLPT